MFSPLFFEAESQETILRGRAGFLLGDHPSLQLKPFRVEDAARLSGRAVCVPAYYHPDRSPLNFSS